MVPVNHDQAILAASKQAKEKLPQLRRDFNAGLEPGEYIYVKAPFETPDDGTEWMWVEVMRWNDGEILGLLKNEPVYIPDLRGGSEVRVDEADVFDYIRYFADGSEEGNETGKLIQQSQGR